jgi:aspartate ammonia-lyase
MRPDVRHETDLLGTLTLPDAAPYGVRTARIARHLGVSGRTLGDYPELVEALLAVKRAAAWANAKAGVIDAETATKIETAIDEMPRDALAATFVVDALHGGGSIGFNVNINEVIARRAGVDHKRDVNASQSTADACATAFRLAVMDSGELLVAAARALAGALSQQATVCADVTTVARTCLQDAMPVSLGALFGGYAALVARRADRLSAALTGLHAINLGGTVIGSGDGASAGYRQQVVAELAMIVDRPLTIRADLYDAAQNPDDLVDVVDAVAAYADALLKLCRDLRLLASGPDGGFSEIELPAVTEGSSFFVGKVNPVVPETVMQAAMQVQGLAHAARLAASHRELYLNVFEGQTAMNTIDAQHLMTAATTMLTVDAIVGLKPRRERCAELLAKHRARVRTP